MSQSTNDTIHVAIHMAALVEIHGRLLPAVRGLVEALSKKACEFDGIVKTGRTHLQDAVPVRLGQEFGAYAGMAAHGCERVEIAADALKEICLGGTAVGTGLNTDPEYRERAIAYIRESTGIEFRAAKNMFEAMQGFEAVLDVTGALRTLITSLRKIADDLRLLSSGPRTGLAEIRLPAVQPGSSIMPGKVNPVMAEMLDMVCFHAMGCDAAILHAAQAGQLELNVMMPVIAYNLLMEIGILAAGIRAFTDKCIAGIEADADKCLAYAERSPSLATALSPRVGYHRAAELAQEALARNMTVRDLAETEKILDPETLRELLDLRRMTEDPADTLKKPGDAGK